MGIGATDSEFSSELAYKVSIVEGIAITVEAPNIVEGNDENQSTFFTVKLSKAAKNQLNIGWLFRDIVSPIGNGFRAIDYNGVLTFLPGELEKKIRLEIIADTQYELNEKVRLSVFLYAEYQGNEFIQIQKDSYLVIENDDSLQFKSGE